MLERNDYPAVREVSYLQLGFRCHSFLSQGARRRTVSQKSKEMVHSPRTHNDRDAHWTVKFSKANPREEDAVPQRDLAIPVFGCKNHVSIDRRIGFIRRWRETDAAAHEGRLLRRGLLDKSNTGSEVWADTAYRSKANEGP